MIKIPKEICEDCGLCCSGNPGQYIITEYNGEWPEINNEGKCPFLSKGDNCIKAMDR